MGSHTLAHAVDPAATGCRCQMSDIKTCVICNRWLDSERIHTDTCSSVCRNRLMKAQRNETEES